MPDFPQQRRQIWHRPNPRLARGVAMGPGSPMLQLAGLDVRSTSRGAAAAWPPSWLRDGMC